MTSYQERELNKDFYCYGCEKRKSYLEFKGDFPNRSFGKCAECRRIGCAQRKSEIKLSKPSGVMI